MLSAKTPNVLLAMSSKRHFGNPSKINYNKYGSRTYPCCTELLVDIHSLDFVFDTLL